MEVRYKVKEHHEEMVKGVDFVNMYPLNNSVFVHYVKDGTPGELIIDRTNLQYLKVYNE